MWDWLDWGNRADNMNGLAGLDPEAIDIIVKRLPRRQTPSVWLGC